MVSCWTRMSWSKDFADVMNGGSLMICTYDLSRLEGLLRCMCIGRRSTQLSGACCYAQIVRMSLGRPSNNPLGKRKVDCLETGFASRVDETSGKRERRTRTRCVKLNSISIEVEGERLGGRTCTLQSVSVIAC